MFISVALYIPLAVPHCLRFYVQMFAQFLYDLLCASMMKVQCGECRSTFQYKDQIRPAE